MIYDLLFLTFRAHYTNKSHEIKKKAQGPLFNYDFLKISIFFLLCPGLSFLIF